MVATREAECRSPTKVADKRMKWAVTSLLARAATKAATKTTSMTKVTITSSSAEAAVAGVSSRGRSSVAATNITWRRAVRLF